MNGYDIDTPEGMRLAKIWTKAHLERITAGGIWVIPRSNAAYRIWHQSRAFEPVGAIGGRDSAAERVMEALGWTLVSPD